MLYNSTKQDWGKIPKFEKKELTTTSCMYMTVTLYKTNQ